VARGPAICILAVAVLAAGCGHADDAPVRTMLQRYLRAMVSHDWPAACAQLSPQLAAQHQFPGAPQGCPEALAAEAGGPGGADPFVQPERANEELIAARVTRIVMLGDRAQVYLAVPQQGEIPLLAVRIGERWRLAQDLGISIPYGPETSRTFN
jgi:hypothetical protein